MFKKKQKPNLWIKPMKHPSACQHKWKDFKWYIDAKWNSDCFRGKIRIIEPYVCIFCKERKEIVLLEEGFKSSVSFDKRVKELKIKYDEYLENRVIIEDQINDFQLVDREYLEIARKLFPDRGI